MPFTLAISHDEHWKCVMCSVFWLAKEPVIQTQSVSVLPPSFSCRLCNDQMKVLGHGQPRNGKCETLCDSMQNWSRNMLQFFCLLDDILISICRTAFVNSVRIECISTHGTTLPRRSHQGLFQNVRLGLRMNLPVVWARLDQGRQPLL